MAVQAMGTTTASREMLAGFVATLQAEGMSPRHREAHRCAVDRLAEYMRPRGAADATSGDVRGFLAYLGELGVSQQSQGVYRDVLSRWLDYLTAIGAQTGLDHAIEASSEAEVTSVAPDDEAAIVTGVMRLDEASNPDHEQTWPLLRGAQAPGQAPGRAPDREGSVAAIPEPRFSAFEPLTVPAMATSAFAEVEPGGWVAPADAPATTGLHDIEEDWLAGPVASATVSTANPALSAFAPPPLPAQQFALTEAGHAGLAEDPFAAPAAPFEPPAAAVRRHVLARPLPPDLPSMPPIGGARPKAVPGGFDPGIPSVPLASAPDYRDGDVTSQGNAPVRETDAQRSQARAAATRRLALDDTSPAWGLKHRGVERSDLGLAAIRDMALGGKVGPEAMIRRPGGEWMRAGHFAPLKAIFHDQAEMLTATNRTQAASAPGRLATGVRAWAGAGVGALAGGFAWWLVTILAGSEVSPVALPCGVLAGASVAMLGGGRAPSRTRTVAACVGTAAGVLLGRYLVYVTIVSGINAVHAADVSGLGGFLVSSLGSSAGLWTLGGIGLGGLVARLLGRRA